MKTSLRRALFTNFGWKVVAVAIATLLWYLLLREAELVAIRTVPVLLKNPPAELILTSSPGPVQVEVAGPVAVLEEAQFRGAAAHFGQVQAHHLARVVVRARQVRLHLLQTETEVLQAQDLVQPRHVGFGVQPVAAVVVAGRSAAR